MIEEGKRDHEVVFSSIKTFASYDFTSLKYLPPSPSL